MTITPKNLSKQVRRQIARSYIPAVAAGSDKKFPFAYFEYDVRVTAARIIPQTDITGNDSDNFTASIVNAGDDGAGTTVVASLEFANGTNASDFAPKELTLSTTEANLIVSAGETLAFSKVEEGDTGLAMPELVVEVEYEIIDNEDRPE